MFNEPHEVITDAIQRTQYFNPDKIDPGFDWRGCKFFNSGIFIARRGIFDLDEYLELLEHQRDHPGSLFGDQGPLNILVFRYAAQGKIKIVDRPLQVVVSTVPVEDLLETYRFERGIPALSSNTPKRLLHWAGKKPDLVTRHPFAEPMTYFRLKHLELARSARRLLGRFGLLAEDIHYRVLSRHRGSYIKAARSKLHWLADGEGRS